MSARWKANPSKRRPGWLVVIGPFDQDFVDDLKRSIALSFRTWDDVLRAWLVHESRASDLAQCIERHSGSDDD